MIGHYPDLKKYIILFGIIILVAEQRLHAADFLVEEDMRLSWVFYNEEQQVMLPFLDNSAENPAAIHLSIDQNYGSEAYLMIDIPAKSSLLINNKFINSYEDQTVKYFLLDSIKRKLNIDSIKFTLFNQNRFQNPTQSQIGFIHQRFDASINVNPISDRELDARVDFLKIIILIIIGFFVVLYTLFPLDLFEFLNLQTIATFRYTETAFIKYRTITKTQSLVIVYQAALLASILIMYLNYYNNPFGETFFMRINPIFGWLILFGLVLFFIFLKFILINIVSVLFKVQDKVNFYFIEFLRMAMVFYSIVFIILCYIVINRFYVIPSFLENLIHVVVGFNLIRFIVIYFKFRRTVPMKSLHLFSYLCTTELIPIIIGLKFFLK